MKKSEIIKILKKYIDMNSIYKDLYLLPDEIIEICIDKIDWDDENLYKKYYLPEKIIEKYKTNLNWGYIKSIYDLI